MEAGCGTKSVVVVGSVQDRLTVGCIHSSLDGLRQGRRKTKGDQGQGAEEADRGLKHGLVCFLQKYKTFEWIVGLWKDFTINL